MDDLFTEGVCFDISKEGMGERRLGAPHCAKGKMKGRSPKAPARSIRVLLLQHEGDLHIDLVARDVAVLDHDVHVLHPRTFNASKRLGSTGYGLVDGVLEACL